MSAFWWALTRSAVDLKHVSFPINQSAVCIEGKGIEICEAHEFALGFCLDLAETHLSIGEVDC